MDNMSLKLDIEQSEITKVDIEQSEITKFDSVVDKESFINYIRVQMSGMYNMWDSRVEEEANITEEQHLYIIRNYENLKNLYFTEEEFSNLIKDLKEEI